MKKNTITLSVNTFYLIPFNIHRLDVWPLHPHDRQKKSVPSTILVDQSTRAYMYTYQILEDSVTIYIYIHL